MSSVLPLRMTGIGLALLAAFCFTGPQARAQQAPSQQTQTAEKTLPSGIFTAQPAVLRLPQDFTNAMPAAQTRSSTPHPFRSTMGDAAYRAAKQAADMEASLAAANGLGKTQAAPFEFQSPSGLVPPSTSTLGVNFNGLDENSAADNGSIYWPPDTDGAVGATMYTEICNDAVRVTSKTSGNILKTTPLSQFFGYTKEAFFDPVVRYDRLWNRWIITATSGPEDATHMYLWVAVSYNNNASGSFYIYALNVAIHSGDFWDYEKTGLTQDAVLFDANIFNGSSYNGASMFSVAKALLYNGLGFSVPIFQGLGGTLTLPIVMDQNATTYLIYNQPGSANIGMYTLTNAAYPGSISLSAPVNIASSVTLNVPRAAKQYTNPSGPAYSIDTSDTRFENYTIQRTDTSTGNATSGHTLIYATTCIALGSFPANSLWILDATAGTQAKQQYYYHNGTSDDFNPNVAVNDSGDMAVEWSSTDAPSQVQAMILCAGAVYGTSIPNGGTLVRGSTTYLSGNPADSGGVLQRWGDYSSVSLDPASETTFWGTNEYILNHTTWSTRNFSFTVTP